MSQAACFLTVENVLVENIFTALIDKDFGRDTLVDVVKETVEVEPNRDCDCEMVWFEIGAGESGTDTFFKDSELIDWCKEGGLDLVAITGKRCKHCKGKCPAWKSPPRDYFYLEFGVMAKSTPPMY